VGSLDKVVLTVVVKSRDIDLDEAPSRDRDHGRLTYFVSNDERCVLGTVLGNSRHLGSQPTIIDGNSGFCVTETYGREHPQGLI
jgi:hypothetical protein